MLMRPMFGGFGRAVGATSIAFVSQLALSSGTVDAYGLRKRAAAVLNCRNIGKADMKLNDARPRIAVDPETYTVTADGEILRARAAEVLPLAQRYFLF
jgi:urease subunit alpha